MHTTYALTAYTADHVRLNIFEPTGAGLHDFRHAPEMTFPTLAAARDRARIINATYLPCGMPMGAGLVRIHERHGESSTLVAEITREYGDLSGGDIGFFVTRETLLVDPGPAMRPAVICGRCARGFDETDASFDGHAQHQQSGFCRSCVDRCHESADSAHTCVICDPPGR
jgi:hypothetical protein